MNQPRNDLESRITGCLLGAAIGGMYGRFIEHRAWQEDLDRRQSAAREFPGAATDLAWGEYGIDVTTQMMTVCHALIEHNGLPAVEDLARVWLREVEPLAFGDDDIKARPPAYPIRYALRNTYELLKAGTPPRIVGAMNVPILTGLYGVAPVAAVNAHDPDEAFLQAVSLASLFQRDRGTTVPGLLASIAASAMRPDATAGSSLNTGMETALRLAGDGTTVSSTLLPLPGGEGRGEGSPEQQGPQRGMAASLLETAIDAGRAASGDNDLFGTLTSLIGSDGKRNPHKALVFVTAVFAFADGDLRKAVATAALEEQSPDFHAASVGALCGALQGVEAIPGEWMGLIDSLKGAPALHNTARRLTQLAVSRAGHTRQRAHRILTE